MSIDDNASMKALVDQCMAAVVDIMPALKAIRDQAIQCGFSEDEAFSLCMTYWEKLVTPRSF